MCAFFTQHAKKGGLTKRGLNNQYSGIDISLMAATCQRASRPISRSDCTPYMEDKRKPTGWSKPVRGEITHGIDNRGKQSAGAHWTQQTDGRTDVFTVRFTHPHG